VEKNAKASRESREKKKSATNALARGSPSQDSSNHSSLDRVELKKKEDEKNDKSTSKKDKPYGRVEDQKGPEWKTRRKKGKKSGAASEGI